MSNRTDRAAKGILASFIQYALQISLQAFLAPMVLHVAGQETLGAYAILMQAIGYLALVDLGFSFAFNTYLAQADGFDGSGRRFQSILTTSRTFLLCSNLASGLLLILCGVWLCDLFSLTPHLAMQARIGLFLLALWSVARTPWIVFGHALTARQHLSLVSIIGIVGNCSRLILSLFLVLIGAGLVGLMIANILAEAIMVGLQNLYFRRLYPSCNPNWGIPDGPLFRQMLGFGSRTFVITVSWRLVAGTDNLVVGYLYGPVAVSMYYTTQMPSIMGYNIINRVTDNVWPAINEMYAKKEEREVRNAFLKLNRYILLLVSPLIVGLLLLNQKLVELWVGRQQYAGDLMTLALSMFVLLITVSHASNPFIYASGKIKTYSILALVEGVLNLILSFWLGFKLGMAGVMLATVIAHVFTAGYLVWHSLRQCNISFNEYLRVSVWPPIIPAILSFFSTRALGHALGFSGWFAFILCSIVLLITYSSIAWMFSIDQSERFQCLTYLRRGIKGLAGRAVAPTIFRL